VAAVDAELAAQRGALARGKQEREAVRTANDAALRAQGFVFKRAGQVERAGDDSRRRRGGAELVGGLAVRQGGGGGGGGGGH